MRCPNLRHCNLQTHPGLQRIATSKKRLSNVEQRNFQAQRTSAFPQFKGNSAIACRGELLDSTTVQDASTASVKCRQSTSKHIAQATKAKTQSCPASLLFNILKRFSSPKASNSTALEPSDAGKVPVLGQSLARKIFDIRQGPNFVLGQAWFHWPQP